MAIADIGDYLKLVPAVKGSPARYLWSSYDAEADVLYVNFKKPSRATDSEITEDHIIIRYEGDEVIGLTILHAASRQAGRSAGRSPTLQARCDAEAVVVVTERREQRAARGTAAEFQMVPPGTTA